jgi:hypothetical protein
MFWSERLRRPLRARISTIVAGGAKTLAKTGLFGTMLE